MLKKKTVEKSKSSASFFWISEFPKPPVTKALAILINTATIVTVPKSFGSNSLANTMETTKLTICAPKRSANDHSKPVITLFLLSLSSLFPQHIFD